MAETSRDGVLQQSWHWFCRATVAVFYSRCEADGLGLLPAQGPVLLCANHTNALADAVVIQALSRRTVHPLARSGLFQNPFLKPVLSLIQAVPVYRREDSEGVAPSNEDAFARIYDLFATGQIVLIFPEGQSHSDPTLREFKTGAARMVLGAKQHGVSPLVIPVGLNFTHKGKFRSQVFVQVGNPINYDDFVGGDDSSEVQRLTQKIQEHLYRLTINVDTTVDLQLVSSLERFIAMRHGKYRRRSMALRFQTMKRVCEGLEELKEQAPEQLAQLRRHLIQFERLCRNWHIRDYHLTIHYQTSVVTRFLLRSISILFLLLPLAAWGIFNSIVPYVLTRHLARLLARGTDQYDTAKMVFGLALFIIFWGLQIVLVAQYFSVATTAAYIFSLPVSAAAAIMFKRERHRIWENLRVFFLFLRKRKLKPYLEVRRKRLERELASMVRLARSKMGVGAGNAPKTNPQADANLVHGGFPGGPLPGTGPGAGSSSSSSSSNDE